MSPPRPGNDNYTNGSSRTQSSIHGHHSLSFLTKVTAFVWWNGVVLTSSVASLLLLLGPFLLPYQVGLCLLLPYFIHILLRRDELHDGRQWRFFSENFPAFRVLRNHLCFDFAPIPAEIIEMEKQPDAQFLVACFPHGTASDFRVLMESILHRIFPNIANNCRTLAASVLFFIPIVREITLWTGCIDARRSVAEKALSRGRTVIVVPGGEAEQLLTRHGEEAVYLSKRKGFIKLAMRKKVPVVPVYVFGSNDMYMTSDWLYKPRHWLMKKFGICIPFSWGLFGSFCPFPVKTTVVMGKPMRFEMEGKDEPTSKEVDEAHKKFCDALVSLFDEHKNSLNYGDRKLRIV